MEEELHSWERPDRIWENPLGRDDAWESASEDEFDYDAISNETAAELLFEFIVDLKLSGKLSAKSACVLAFYAVKAGVVGCEDLKKIALNPTAQSGKYSRQFDQRVGHPDSEGYVYVDAAMNSRSSSARLVNKVPILPAHDCLVAEWALANTALQEQRDAMNWPRCFWNHPVYKSATQAGRGEFVWPIALYMDGVQFTREDSCLGIWLICLITGRRWLLVALRKSEMCGCGCRGWCTLWPVYRAVAWSLRALAKGKYMSLSHDGQELPEDRRVLADKDFGFRASVLYIKGDWMEYASSLAFPTWASAFDPCMMCQASLSEAYRLLGASALGPPWPRKTLEWYKSACEACEVRVALTDETYREIRAVLVYDKRKAGKRGRVLAIAVPSVGLEAGDRLEPSDLVPDVGNFDQSAPAAAIFWRVPARPNVHHRNPLFAEELGTGPQSLVVDNLHAGSFGVFKAACERFTWSCFAANCWHVNEVSAEATLQTNAVRVRAELFAWYKTEERQGRMHNRVQDLVYHMFGSADEPDLRLHAGEMNGYLHFCLHLAQRFAQSLPQGGLWLTALGGLCRMQNMICDNPEIFSDADCQLFCDTAVTALGAMQDLKIVEKPKFHAWIHLATDVYWKGSPALWANWLDEGLNKMLKSVGMGAHRHGWHERALANVNGVLERRVRRRHRKIERINNKYDRNNMLNYFDYYLKYMAVSHRPAAQTRLLLIKVTTALYTNT